MKKDFLALPGIYYVHFLYIEPLASIVPFFMIWGWPGAEWCYQQLLPEEQRAPLDIFQPQAEMAMWQLANTSLLLGLVSLFVYRAVRDAVPNPASQERVIGAVIAALGVGDILHLLLSFYVLPERMRWAPLTWDGMAHGNITVVLWLLVMRLLWVAGVGREKYWFGVGAPSQKVA
ncbi:hypothetical protein BKA70DRAFT_1417941 [Coprinopsis sp. MPI-PUGE-AT-0042]|nr:hypothetical protein BKA70DRAFT_1417941 [Coprinopsis sp. MPI-PUGE-AT-0042]